MQKVYDICWKNDKNSAVALGYFDGVHVGHQFLINEMKRYALANNLCKAVFTFTKNIKLGHKGKDIISIEQKIDIMENMDIDLFYSPNFSVFSELSPEEFVQKVIVQSMSAKAVFCGNNFFFGKNRAGNVQLLKRLCKENGIELFVVPTVEVNGEIVSSTLIRNALLSGEIEQVNNMLNRPYYINFAVKHGKSLGRTLGTPTINQVYPDNMCTPKEGVYITITNIEGKKYPSATGFGTRPTVNGTTHTSETFIEGFTGDLYNKNIKVEFYKYLYKPQKFDTLQQLSDMILSSAAASKEYFKENGII